MTDSINNACRDATAGRCTRYGMHPITITSFITHNTLQAFLSSLEVTSTNRASTSPSLTRNTLTIYESINTVCTHLTSNSET